MIFIVWGNSFSIWTSKKINNPVKNTVHGFLLVTRFRFFIFATQMGKGGIILVWFLSCFALSSVAQDSLKVEEEFNLYSENFYNCLNDTSLTYDAFRQALQGYYHLKAQAELEDTTVFSVVDFSKSGNEKRFYVISILEERVLHKSLVAHGQKTGGLYAKNFSNTDNSHQSSYGFYVTATKWDDSRLGTCLQLRGKEYCNWKALTRGIVIHAADYATEEWVRKYGTLGRSYGCPALPFKEYDKVMELIDNRTAYFIYFPSKNYQRYSKILNSSIYLGEFSKDFGFVGLGV